MTVLCPAFNLETTTPLQQTGGVTRPTEHPNINGVDGVIIGVQVHVIRPVLLKYYYGRLVEGGNKEGISNKK
jgi:hypothetical protein